MKSYKNNHQIPFLETHHTEQLKTSFTNSPLAETYKSFLW